jgi:hypothetical protein
LSLGHMIVTEQVQRAMNHDVRPVRVERLALLVCLARDDFPANDDVAERLGLLIEEACSRRPEKTIRSSLRRVCGSAN